MDQTNSARAIRRKLLAAYIDAEGIAHCEAQIDESFKSGVGQIEELLEDVLYVCGENTQTLLPLLRRIMIVDGVARKECHRPSGKVYSARAKPAVLAAIAVFLKLNCFEEFKALCWIIPEMHIERRGQDLHGILASLFSREKLPFLHELLIVQEKNLARDQLDFLLSNGSLEAILLYLQFFLKSNRINFDARDAFDRIRLNENVETLPAWPAELLRLFVECMRPGGSFGRRCIVVCVMAAQSDVFEVFDRVFEEFVACEGVVCKKNLIHFGELDEIARYARVYSLDKAMEFIFMNFPLDRQPRMDYVWQNSEEVSYKSLLHCLRYPISELETSEKITRLYMWHPRLQAFAEYAYTLIEVVSPLLALKIEELFKICVYSWVSLDEAPKESHAFYVLRKSTPEAHAKESRAFCESLYTIVYLLSDLVDQRNAKNIYKKLMAPSWEYPPFMKIATISIMHPMNRGDDWFAVIPFIDYEANHDPKKHNGRSLRNALDLSEQ